MTKTMEKILAESVEEGMRIDISDHDPDYGIVTVTEVDRDHKNSSLVEIYYEGEYIAVPASAWIPVVE